MPHLVKWRAYAGDTFLGVADDYNGAVMLFNRYVYEQKHDHKRIVSPYCYRYIPERVVTMHPNWTMEAADD